MAGKSQAKKVGFEEVLNGVIEEGNEVKENEVDSEASTPIPPKEDSPILVIGKKVKKNTKKSFPVYMEEERVKQIDKISAKTGYTRNELINMFVEFALNNSKI